MILCVRFLYVNVGMDMLTWGVYKIIGINWYIGERRFYFPISTLGMENSLRFVKVKARSLDTLKLFLEDLIKKKGRDIIGDGSFKNRKCFVM